MLILRWVLIVVGGLAALGGLFLGGGLIRLSRTQPETEEVILGVSDGRLSECPESPNCVSTQADPSDTVHHADPIPYSGPPGDVLTAVENWIASQDRSEVVESQDRYLRAVFSSRVFGFSDDLELYVAEDVVHFRSASRVGYGDMGVNRDRYRRVRAVITGSDEP